MLFTGISLPKAYLYKQKRSLITLLGPVMTIAWFICSLLVWGLIPGLTFLESLVIGACVTPTDPVLANSICKGEHGPGPESLVECSWLMVGRFAEQHVPLHVRNIIVAEAGANDGLGFPFLFLPLYLILRHSPTHPIHTVGGAIGEWCVVSSLAAHQAKLQGVQHHPVPGGPILRCRRDHRLRRA